MLIYQYIEMILIRAIWILVYMGSVKNDILALGPTRYLFFENGKVYTFEYGEYENKYTGEVDPPEIRYIGKLSKAELADFENELKNLEELDVNSYDIIELMDMNVWHITINGESKRVNINGEAPLLDKYIKAINNHTQQ